MGPTAWTEVIARLALLIGAAWTLVWLFRLIRWPGGRPSAALIGGVLAGVACGPGVLGLAAPAFYERTILGGSTERAALSAAEDRHAEDAAALRDSGVSPVAVDELIAQHARARIDLERALAEAEHRQAQAGAAAALGAFVAAALASAMVRRRRHIERSTPGELVDGSGVIAGWAAGLMAGLVAGLTTAALARWLLGMPLGAAVGLGGAIAGGSLLTGVPMRWTPEIGRTPAARAMAGGLTLTALAGVGWAIWTHTGGGAASGGWGAWGPWMGWIGLALAWAVGSRLGMDRPPRGARRAARWAVLWVGVPLIAAELAVRVEWGALLHGPWPLLLLGLAALACGDGHGLGGWLGLKSLAPARVRREPGLLTIEVLARGVTATSIAVMLALVAAGVVNPGDHPGAAASALILVNAASFETQLDWARPFARKLDGTIEDEP